MNGGTGQRVLVRDGTFAVLDGRGDIRTEADSAGAPGVSGGPYGLFRRDARHLSRWLLTVGGTEPTLLVPGPDGAHGTAVLTPPGVRDQPPAYTVFREQEVKGGALRERVRLVGNSAAAVTVTVTVAVDADFADQFELRGNREYAKPGAERTCEPHADGVEFHYRRGEWHSRTAVTARPAPDRATEAADGARLLHWTLTVPPHGAVALELRADTHPFGAPPAVEAVEAVEAGSAPVASPPAEPDGEPDGDLARACAQGLADLAALRIPATGPDGEPVRPPAAGIPWFLTLFGRDALLTSLFTLPYEPALADATLLALAATQADRTDPERVAQPGKIVHEIRHGELAHFGQVPYGSYYGSVDSTPLFLVLLGARTERTGDDTLARRLEGHARRALDWLFRHGGLDDRGYLVYHADEGGLANQNWKDSPGAVCTTDGTQAEGAIAVAEAQGYAYDALRRGARMARTAWADPDFADRLEHAADALRDRFRRDFWMPRHGFPALALDGDGRQADALASDAGHLLWSGILGREDGVRVGRRLLEPDFFSGWGIRTLAAGQPAYHPLSYHRGSIWPHDNAVAALGLARYGLHEEARALARGLLAAAARHEYRLPEVLAGYGRDTAGGRPVPYPHACSPQAWAAATPLALRTALESSPPGD
ncbi:aminotransferase [Streptomyces armeniacus]|uniref:Aminotransferase n=1 Tax=Streptomyces armeniacus TaxID=83291 RepID=A0A345XSD7_9ACTN|nr:glycogen debranching N-terminal domain-containing protein [Streptomyces armeniacus]AXK34553.1 aminotransferase [Streptomyces armeniacus]